MVIHLVFLSSPPSSFGLMKEDTCPTLDYSGVGPEECLKSPRADTALKSVSHRESFTILYTPSWTLCIYEVMVIFEMKSRSE